MIRRLKSCCGTGSFVFLVLTFLLSPAHGQFIEGVKNIGHELFMASLLMQWAANGPYDVSIPDSQLYPAPVQQKSLAMPAPDGSKNDIFQEKDEEIVNQIKQVTVERNTFSETGEYTLNVHFLPEKFSTRQETTVSLDFNVANPQIDWFHTSGATAHAFDGRSFSFGVSQTSSVVMLKWQSGNRHFLDVLVPVIQPIVTSIITYSLLIPELSGGRRVVSQLQEISYQPVHLPLKPETLTLPDILGLNRAIIVAAYLALLEKIIDMLTGDYVASVAPEHYKTTQFLSGVRGTGLSSSVSALDSSPSHPFTANAPSGVHYRNWKIMFQVPDECESGNCSPEKSLDIRDGRSQLGKTTPEKKPVKKEQPDSSSEHNIPRPFQKWDDHGQGNVVSEAEVTTTSPSPEGGQNTGTEPEPAGISNNSLPSSSDDSPIPSIISYLIQSLSKVVNHFGSIENAQQEHRELYSLTVIAVSEFLDSEYDETTASGSSAFNELQALLKQQKLESIDDDEVYEGEKLRFYNSNKPMTLICPDREASRTETPIENLPALVSDISREIATAFQNPDTSLPEWLKFTFTYALRMFFEEDSILNRPQRLHLAKILDTATGRWRSMISSVEGDVYAWYDDSSDLEESPPPQNTLPVSSNSPSVVTMNLHGASSGTGQNIAYPVSSPARTTPPLLPPVEMAAHFTRLWSPLAPSIPMPHMHTEGTRGRAPSRTEALARPTYQQPTGRRLVGRPPRADVMTRPTSQHPTGRRAVGRGAGQMRDQNRGLPYSYTPMPPARPGFPALNPQLVSLPNQVRHILQPPPYGWPNDLVIPTSRGLMVVRPRLAAPLPYHQVPMPQRPPAYPPPGYLPSGYPPPPLIRGIGSSSVNTPRPTVAQPPDAPEGPRIITRVLNDHPLQQPIQRQIGSQDANVRQPRPATAADPVTLFREAQQLKATLKAHYPNSDDPAKEHFISIYSQSAGITLEEAKNVYDRLFSAYLSRGQHRQPGPRQ